jgi:MFS family permease
MASYMVCILGGYLADNFIGARRAVLIGGLIITTGHYALAFDSVPTFYAGLILIALGTGLLEAEHQHARRRTLLRRRYATRRRLLALLHGHQPRRVRRAAGGRLAGAERKRSARC